MPLLALLLSLLLAGGGLRVLVRVSDGDGELLRRIEGQTVDLQPGISLTPLPGALEPEPEAQVRAAALLARERGAQVIVWVRRLPDGAQVVCVADPAAGLLLERRLAAARPGAPLVARSAAAEGAALIVRSALRALLRGEHVGEPAPALRPAAPAAARPSPPDGAGAARPAAPGLAGAARPAAPVPATTPARGPGLALQLGGGWQVAFDGASPPGQHGLLLRGGLRRGPWSASLVLVGGLPAHLRDELTDVELSRHAILAQGAWCAPLGRRLCLGGALGAGALLHYRRTEALSAAARPTDPRGLPAFVLQPAAILGVAALPRLRAELAVGADVVLPTPALGYDVAGQLQARDSLWPVQPRLGLTLLYDGGR